MLGGTPRQLSQYCATVRGSNPGGDKIFSPLHAHLGRIWGPPKLLIGAGVLSPGVKTPRHEVGHSTPSNAEVKNQWGCTSVSPHTVHGLDKVNLSFTILRLFFGVINRNSFDDWLASFSFRCWRNVLLVIKCPFSSEL